VVEAVMVAYAGAVSIEKGQNAGLFSSPHRARQMDRMNRIKARKNPGNLVNPV
jgi:hypothetical protein